MGIDYAWEKTMVAITSMAASPASIQDRIASAFVDSLIRITPEEDLPSDLRPLYEEIRAVFSVTPAKGGEGTAIASARALSTERAAEVADKIVRLYDGVIVERMRADRRE